MSRSRGYKTVVRIEATQAAVVELRADFLSFLESMEVSEENINGWKLLYTEAATNAIKYGSPLGEEDTLLVEWLATVDGIYLTIEDHGKGPPKAQMNQPALPEDPYSENGRGLFLIRQFADRTRHWVSADGYRLESFKTHPSVCDPIAEIPEMERVLDELSSSYESLSAFYRLGANIITADSNIAAFIEHSMKDYRQSYECDLVEITLRGALLPSLEEELARCDVVNLGSQLDLEIESGDDPIWELVWDQPEEIKKVPGLREYACGVCLPILAGNKCWGHLVVARYDKAAPFEAAELNTLNTFADLFGIAVANRYLRDEHDREQQVAHEMRLAAQIQKQLLPFKPPPESEEWEIVIKQNSAREVAGDYAESCYDGSGSMCMTIIDVMGKGISAAILATIYRTSFHIQLHACLELDGIMNALNHSLRQQIGDMTIFVTAAIVRVASDGSRMEIVNAGHCPPLVARDRKLIAEPLPSGPPLGLVDDVDYQITTISLEGGEEMVLATDGCYEWRKDGHPYGWDLFRERVVENIHNGPEAFWNNLQRDIETNMKSENSDRKDDETLVVWRNLR